MTKRGGVRSWIALLLLLVSIAYFTNATESDSKEATTSTKKTEVDADLKLAPPVTEKAEEEKKAEEETKQKTELGEPKETVNKKKDETLEEAESRGKSEKGSADGDSPVEECDPTNRCVDEKSNLVACLRVPGEDLLDLSLLIQNKGKAPLHVKIIAPDFVGLEQNAVQLKAKDNAEVKVSVKDRSGNDTVIVLQVGEGSCRLDFQNMVSDLVKNSETTTVPGYSHRLSMRSCFILIVLAAAVVIGLGWSCIRFWRMKRRKGGSPKYQLIDGLPISTGGKKDNSEADGWDNSWGDDWDDEEAAPVTPSKPALTPSFKRLASRKSSKDSWKD